MDKKPGKPSADQDDRALPKLSPETTQPNKLRDGDSCAVIGGTHAGKSGTVRDINTSKTGHVTITVEQKDGVRFKTLARNVLVKLKKEIRPIDDQND